MELKENESALVLSEDGVNISLPNEEVLSETSEITAILAVLLQVGDKEFFELIDKKIIEYFTEKE